MSTKLISWWLVLACAALILLLWALGFGNPVRADGGTSSAQSTASSTCATSGNKTICYNAQSSMTCTKINNVTTCEVIRK
jgi:hypothetical protein